MIQFLNPALLWGTLLVAGPIIIHLLLRRRFRKVAWAAMKLLRLSEVRSRRKTRLEELILLILRCLALLLLALLLARPLLDLPAFASRLARSQVERVIVLDDSPSMTYKIDGRTLFDRAKEGLGRFVASMAREAPGDTLSIFLTSRPRRPWLRARMVTPDTLPDVNAAVESLQPSGLPARYSATFLAVSEVLEEDKASAERMLYLLSDLRAGDWFGESEQETRAQIERLADNVGAFQFIPISDSDLPNIAITGVRSKSRRMTAGAPAAIEVDVRNLADKPVDELEVKLALPAGLPQITRIRNLPPGEKQTVLFSPAFQQPGSVAMHVEIPRDGLAVDDKFPYVLDVQPASRVLLIDGEPARGAKSDTFFLRHALVPGGNIVSGFEVEVVSEEAFAAKQLEDVALVGLCNVRRLPPAEIEALTAWVRQGGGVVVFLGDQADRDWWQTILREWLGAPEAKLVEIEGDPTGGKWDGLRIDQAGHPVNQIFAGESNPFLDRIKILRWWGLETGGESDAATVLSTRKSGQPLLLHNGLEAGNVLVFTTSADTEWGTWPLDPSYLLVMQEAARSVASIAGTDPNLIVGAPIVQELDPTLYGPDLKSLAPGESMARPVRAEVADGRLRAELPPTRAAGVYTLTLQAHEGGEEQRFWAAHTDPAESNLVALERDRLRQLLPDREHVVINAVGAFSPLSEELASAAPWRMLGVLLLIVLFVEQTLAWKFGSRRRAPDAGNGTGKEAARA